MVKEIETNKEIAFGEPVITGARISVEFIMELLSSGWTTEKILKYYPHLKKFDILAALNYSRELLKEWKRYPLVADKS